jgi:hypothetical protein
MIILRGLVDWVNYDIKPSKFYLRRPKSDAEFIAEAQKKDLVDLGKGVFL